jgi:hypothetical protein
MKKKLHGKARVSSVLTIQRLSYHKKETCDCSLFILGPLCLFKSRVEISFKVGRL